VLAIQRVPRLPEPTLVTAVLMEGGTHVKGQPLFQFDRTIYEAKVQQLKAELAGAQQNVRVLEADVALAEAEKNSAQAMLAYAEYRKHAAETLQQETFGTVLEADQWTAAAGRDTAAVNEADSKLKRAVLKLESAIGGVNTTVASIEVQLQQARYYLDNTTMVAPEDGRIVNLQVRLGMVSGILRVGGFAAFIVDSDRYVLATYYQEQLKYVRPGQKVEVAIDGKSSTGRWARHGGRTRTCCRGSTRPIRIMRWASSPCRFLIRRSSRSARIVSRRSTPAAAGSRRCAR
jgi:multidrug resistance efflux pump